MANPVNTRFGQYAADTVDQENGSAIRSGRLSLPMAFGATTAILVLFAAA
jgi:hypothetical protein